MNKIEFVGLDQYLYKETLENGLTVYFVPYDNKNNYSMHYVAKYGSVDTSFVPIKEEKEIKVPDGIAHFLEHKMFETETGEDPFTFAAKSGTDCNAATYYRYTRYLFEGNKNFEENLDYLLTYVHTPYFTKENVEKEKGIIIEELLQYQDMVDCVLDDVTKEGIFCYDPMRVDIGGTVDSVKQITKEDLDITYQTFYQPSNMFLVITGHFDKEKAMEIIRNNKALNQAPTNYPIARKSYKEPSRVNQEEQEISFNTTTTKMTYSIKIDCRKEKKSQFYITNLYLSAMLSMLFGLSSRFRERMKKEKKYTAFHYYKDFSNGIIYITFEAETEEPEFLMNEIRKEITNMDLVEKEFKRVIKVWISSEVIMMDNINVTLDNIVYDVIEYGDVIPNKTQIYKSLEFDELVSTMKNIDFSNVAKVIVRPKNQDQ